MDNNKAINIKQRRGLRKKLVIIIVGLIIAALAGICTWQFLEMRNLRNPENTAAQAKADAAELKNEVAKLMQLPDEDATIATVQDAQKLSGQEFFKDAKNGDKVLIFTQAKRAVIYRPSENKIVNAGPVVINSASSTARQDQNSK